MPWVCYNARKQTGEIIFTNPHNVNWDFYPSIYKCKQSINQLKLIEQTKISTASNNFVVIQNFLFDIKKNNKKLYDELLKEFDKIKNNIS